MERSTIIAAPNPSIRRRMEELRAEFPVLERIAYLNAGTNGPVPRAAVDAVTEDVRRQAEEGRGGGPFFELMLARLQELRARVAALLNADTAEVALTASTTDGVNAVLNALDLGPGDEVLTSDEEHPGVLAPLGSARARHGIRVRVAPFESLAREVTPDTRLVACSHVSWITGQVVDMAGVSVPVLLDGAQGLGAVPTDVRDLGCDFYAASGQKWLCGPNGSGYLYVRGELASQLPAPWPGYMSLAASDRPLDFELHDDARRFDTGLPASQHIAWALAALDTLERPGIERVQAYAADLAGRLADQLAQRGARVAPRGRSTLVSWEDADPPGTVERLRDEGIVVRNLPGTSYVRASVGGWSDEQDIERLLAAAV
jgi:selenocysteine lyase/cysteine desulfurase